MRRVLGEDLFRKLAADYLTEHPSQFPSLSDVGVGLAEFSQGHALRERFPFLPDLARLEWFLLRAFYAEEMPLLNPATLRGVPNAIWATARMTLDFSVGWLESEWPLDEIWRARLSSDEVLERTLVDLENAPRAFLIYKPLRPRHTTIARASMKVERLKAYQLNVLSRIQAGRCLAEICEGLEQFSTAAHPEIMTWFSKWISSGVIRKIEFLETSASSINPAPGAQKEDSGPQR